MFMEYKVNTINLIITEKMDMDDDLSIVIGKLALSMTLTREMEIVDIENFKRDEKG